VFSIPPQTSPTTSAAPGRRIDQGRRAPGVVVSGLSSASHDSPPGAALLVEAMSRMSALVAQPAEEGADLLLEVLELARDTVPGARWATLSAGDDVQSMQPLVATHRRAQNADELQFRLQSGPTVDAAQHRDLVLTGDFTTETRWPVLAEQLTDATPVRAILAFPVEGLAAGPAALTLYGGAQHDFANPASAVAVTVAATALAGLTQRQLVAALHRKLLANRRIGVAVGMLMVSHHQTEQWALETLLAAAQAGHRDVADIADDIVRTGSLPGA
jgi:hypothetical protein